MRHAILGRVFFGPGGWGALSLATWRENKGGAKGKEHRPNSPHYEGKNPRSPCSENNFQQAGIRMFSTCPYDLEPNFSKSSRQPTYLTNLGGKKKH